jgi:hypothetical protein
MSSLIKKLDKWTEEKHKSCPAHEQLKNHVVDYFNNNLFRQGKPFPEAEQPLKSCENDKRIQETTEEPISAPSPDETNVINKNKGSESIFTSPSCQENVLLNIKQVILDTAVNAENGKSIQYHVTQKNYCICRTRH